MKLDFVFIGLSLSSAWGNGHATTYRSLIRGLNALGHNVLFLERDVPWYRSHRDLPNPDFCRLEFYEATDELRRFAPDIKDADAVIVGSYVPDGVAVIELARRIDPRMLCFYDVDTPVTMAKLEAGDEEYIARSQIPEFDIYFSFAGGNVLDRLERRYRAHHALALYCSVDASSYYNTGEPERWDLSYLGTHSHDRQPALERLFLEPARRLPEMRFVVAGPQYPADIQWPANVERIEHLPPADHASFYSRSRFTLNVTRSDMIAAGSSPSVRLFEASACSTPIISDRWRGQEDILPETEALLIANTSDDVVEFLTSIPTTRRHLIADTAHRRVLARHTGEARARELADHVLFHEEAGLGSVRRRGARAPAAHTPATGEYKL